MIDWIGVVFLIVIGIVGTPAFLSKKGSDMWTPVNLIAGCGGLFFSYILYAFSRPAPVLLAASLFNVMIWIHSKYWDKRIIQKQSLRRFVK